MLSRSLFEEGDDSFGGGHGDDVPRKGGERGGLMAAVLGKINYSRMKKSAIEVGNNYVS